MKLMLMRLGKVDSLGVTLIELLVVLAILTILMALSAPSYSRYLDKNKLMGLTRQLVEALNVTKQLAIVRGQQHYFNVQVNHLGNNTITHLATNSATNAVTNSANSALGLCWNISHLKNCHCLTANTLCQSRYGQVSVDISDIALVINRASLSFSPLLGTTNGASYQLSLGRFSTQVIVSGQGRIRTCMVRGESAIYAAC